MARRHYRQHTEHLEVRPPIARRNLCVYVPLEIALANERARAKRKQTISQWMWEKLRPHFLADMLAEKPDRVDAYPELRP